MKWNYDIVLAKLTVEIELLSRFQHPNRFENFLRARRWGGGTEPGKSNGESDQKKFSHCRFWGFNAS